MAVNVPQSPKVGNDCKLYFNDVVGGGTQVDPIWVEIQEASDVTLAEWNVSQAEVVTRASDWAVNLNAKFRAAIEFQYLWGGDWPVLNVLRDTYLARGTLEVAFMDGPITAVPNPEVEVYSQGLRMHVNIAQFPINQANEEAVMVDTVRLVPALVYVTEVAEQDQGNSFRDDPYWYWPERGDGVPVVLAQVFKDAGLSDAQIARKVKPFEGGGFVEVEARELMGTSMQPRTVRGSRLVNVRKDYKEVIAAAAKVAKKPTTK